MVKYSQTPREIKRNVPYFGENGILFDAYEQARYDADENIAVSDETVKLCEDAIGDLQKQR